LEQQEEAEEEILQQRLLSAELQAEEAHGLSEAHQRRKVLE